MSGYKDILKHGWHPEKEGTTLKGQMKSLVGRGDNTRRTSSHTAAPLSSLRDPSTFAPPPKRYTNTTGSGGVSPANSSSPVSQTGPTAPPAPASEEPAPPTKPWRLDTTGLSTAHLPLPPVRRDGADGRSPPPPPYTPSSATGASSRPRPPNLPPRLPPRSDSASPTTTSPTAAPVLPTRAAVSSSALPPTKPRTAASGADQGFLNQTAVNRLGAAGISVPGLGIGSGLGSGPPAPPPATPGRTVTGSVPSSGVGMAHRSNPNLSELQSRFSQLKTSSSPSPGIPTLRAAATSTATAVAKKKPPPPPPPPSKKKPSIISHGQTKQRPTGLSSGSGSDADDGAPPPIPIATRPQF
ncbi:hypothetical protein MFIFM68171_10935 [Madurella fahalii]|uniref:Uncharacterized protein n=1 Tax=Madurella fahalii TaxID=1157608 RepID=A0ABQ0GSL4_9PEZI